METDRNRYAPHIDEIQKALDEKIDRDEIEKKLVEYVEKFLIDLPSAKNAIVKNYGGNIEKLGMPRSLMSLRENEPSVNLQVKILSINPKTIFFDGQEKKIFYGLMGDSSGVLPFTMWADKGLEKGNTVLIENAYVKDKFNDKIQINLGNRVVIKNVAPENIGDIPRTENIGGACIKINKLEGGMNNVCLKGNVFNIRERKVNVKGEEKTVYSGVIGDDTGTVSFSVWEVIDFKVGDTIKISNAYIKTWNGRIQLSFNNYTSVEHLTQDNVDMSGLGYKVKEFREGMEYVNTKVRIISLESREVNAQGGIKMMFSGICGDETGTCSFTAWKDFDLEQDDVIAVQGAYIRQWRGPQLTLGDSTTVKKMDRKELPPLDDLSQEPFRTIESLVESDGAMNVKVEGVILDVQRGSGLIWRCPLCRRVLHKDICTIHKKVEGEPDLRTKCVLDDGTGAIQLIVSCALTEQLLELTLEDALAEARENFANPDLLMDKLFDILVARPVTIRGNVNSDDFGVMMIAKSIEYSKFSPETEALDMLEELGV